MKWFFQILQQEIFPNFYAYIANKKVRVQYEELNARNITTTITGPELVKIREVLETYQESEAQRTRTIEEKARSSLFVIALSVTLSLTIIGLVRGVQVSAMAVVSFATCILAVGYLILACVTALRVINIQEFHSISISDFVKESDGSLEQMTFTEEEHTSRLYKALLLNQHVNIAKANFLYATLIGIRNGILLFAVFFLVLLIDKPVDKKNDNEAFRFENTWINHVDSSLKHRPERADSMTSISISSQDKDTMNAKK